MRVISCRTLQIGLLLAAMAHSGHSEDCGVINDPDGFTYVRSGQSSDSPVIAKVLKGQIFKFDAGEGSEWWKVILDSGTSGWMHYSRIRSYFTLDEIPETNEEGSEVSYYGEAHGFNYNKVAHAAAKGEPGAMKQFFGITDADGGAAETHAWYLCKVVHVLGDEKLAAFLKDQPLDFQLGLRNQLGEVALYPFEAGGYLKRNFPKTAAILLHDEITDWKAPNGEYAVRKKFSSEWPSENSKVVKAEVIEIKTGRVMADLTTDDIGEGLFREGKALWAPDSKRLAYFSGGMAGSAQTVVLELKAEKFARVEQPPVDFPADASDKDLEDAKLIWSHIEPQKWEDSGTIVLEHHNYYEGKRANSSIRSEGRTYKITWNVATGNIGATRITYGM
jgi:hypothetical protein